MRRCPSPDSTERLLQIERSAFLHSYGTPALMLAHCSVRCFTNRLQDLGRLDEALPYYALAIRITESTLGKDTPEVALLLTNFASLLKSRGELAEATTLLRRALAIERASVGDDEFTPRVGGALNDLAMVLKARGKLDEAALLFREALQIDMKARGNDDPIVARGMHNLAMLLYKMDNDSVEARRLGHTALAICERTLGARHPNTQMLRSMWTEHVRLAGESREAHRARLDARDKRAAQARLARLNARDRMARHRAMRGMRRAGMGDCECCPPAPAPPPPVGLDLAAFTAMCEEETSQEEDA